MTGPRNWDKELADIDKVIASDKALPTGSAAPARVMGNDAGAMQQSSRPMSPATRKRDLAWVWLRALIGIGAVAALPFWAYPKACGAFLYLYLAATSAVTLFGLWTMHGAWTHRRAMAHIGGFVVFLGGLSFTLIQILQRTSYAAVRLPWTCP